MVTFGRPDRLLYSFSPNETRRLKYAGLTDRRAGGRQNSQSHYETSRRFRLNDDHNNLHNYSVA
jgi:hypothetical protein